MPCDLPPRVIPTFKLVYRQCSCLARCLQAKVLWFYEKVAIPPQAPADGIPESYGVEGIVLLPPPFDNHLGLFKSIENLPVENLISELSIERFVVSILPRAARLDEQSLDCDSPQNHRTRHGCDAWAGDGHSNHTSCNAFRPRSLELRL